MTHGPPRAPGLQEERTLLAWRRTGLALLVCSLTIGRLVLESLGPAVVVSTLLATAVSLWMLVEERRRRQISSVGVGRHDASVLSGGHLPASVTVVVMALGAGEFLAALGKLV